MARSPRFLAIAGLVSLTLLFSACAPAPAPTPTPKPAPPPAVQPTTAPKPAPTAPAAPKPTAAPTAAPAAKPAPTAAPAKPAPTAAAPAKPKTLDKVTLRLAWKFGQTPMHYVWLPGLEKGFYADNGLDVQVLEGAGSVATLQAIAANNDTFGLSSIATTMEGISQGMPVKSIFEVGQKGPEAVMWRNDSGVKTIKDLEGQTLGGVSGDSALLFLPAFFKAVGVEPAKVNIATMDALARNQAMIAGRVKVVSGYTYGTGVTLKQAGIQYDQALFADHGVNILGETLLANNATIKDKPDLVRRFLDASVKSFKYARDRTEETADMAVKRSPDVVKKELAVAHMKELWPLIQPADRSKDIGWHSAEAIKKLEDILVQYGNLKQKPSSPDAYYSNDFLPK